jgi:hypothetical protein
LPLPDEIRTPVPPPVGQPVLTVTYPGGPHVLTVRLALLSGDEMLYYRFTHRKKVAVDFDASEAGMTVYFCARYENEKGEFGSWGPVVSAIIP